MYICDGAYAADEILAMEINVLNVLQFEVTVCTSQRFLDSYLKLGNILKEVGLHDKMQHLSQYLIELSLLDYRFNRYRPSLIATAALCLGYHGAGHSWGAFLAQSPYGLRDIRQCMQDLLELHRRALSLQLKSVSSKFSVVARLQLADCF